MRPKLAVLMTIGLCFSINTAAAQEDMRETISLPPDLKQQFMAEMRAHMGNLDDIMLTLAEGDFKGAARIAEIHMDFGHSLWEAMAAAGKTDAEIAEAKARFRSAGRGPGQGQGQGQGQGTTHTPGQGMGGGGMGLGRFMPEDFRSMGMVFHDAAGNFAETARAVGPQPSVEDYQAVVTALQEITTACRGCHEVYRVE